MSEAITIIGDGSMATVCALLLESQGHRVTVWGPIPEHVETLIQTRENKRYLPGHRLPDSLVFTANTQRALENARLVINAIPTQYIRAVWLKIGESIPDQTPIVSVAKGIEIDTQLRPTQIISDCLHKVGRDDPDGKPRPLAALSGPSVAEELARCLPATVCAASENEAFAVRIQELFSTHWFRVYTNPDLLGVELAGALKNVIAIAAGILDGLQAGNNAKSALLARGLAEITRLGAAMGASVETFYGLTGVGDLATTCFSPTGRNRTCGELLGRGRKLDDVLAAIPGVVEGVPTTSAVRSLAVTHRVEMPITEAVHEVLFEGLDPLEAISRLMQRPLRSESPG
ncbi:MAG: NAD(P)-dependent glycerol-3-phosphate dehydrogenase [Phycisphaeraceae bacterium]|nr:NAD(P)-dependent glycerol-3-phosphate dehydrogenase [Phycisphaeraceae bacterium]